MNKFKDTELTQDEIDSIYNRILDKRELDDESGCWNYSGYLLPIGYARIGIGNKNMGYAHRIAYLATKGMIPDGLLVRHLCHNRACFNPDHLEVGTHQDNSDDMVNAGRSPRMFGERNGNAKLTTEDVLEIRQRHLEGDSTRELAQEFGVSYGAIREIVLFKKWSHVS